MEEFDSAEQLIYNGLEFYFIQVVEYEGTPQLKLDGALFDVYGYQKFRHDQDHPFRQLELIPNGGRVVVLAGSWFEDADTVLPGTQPGQPGGSAGLINPKDFGAAGNGDNNDGPAIQAAINFAQGAGLTVWFPGGTYAIGAPGLSITANVNMRGNGTLRLQNGQAADLLTISGSRTLVKISDLTFDGNEQNQVAESPNRTINFIATGTDTEAAGLEVRNCTFINGAYTDLRVHTDGTTASLEWVRIIGNTFLAGREGTTLAYDPRYVDLSSPTDYVVEGNIFDRVGGPTFFGRAGIAAYDGFGTFVEGRGAIVGNTFVHVGRSQATSSLGAIDLYSRAHSVVISGNSITAAHGRGINVKAESRAVAIVGNTIEGLSGGSDGTVSAQIVLNASSTAAEANGPFTIAGNSLINSGNDGISISARDTGGTAWAHGVLVTGNTVTNAARRSIGVAMGAEVSIVDNVIVGGAVGIFADAVTTALHIVGNEITTPTGNCIQVTNANATAWVNIAKNTTVGGTRGVFLASAAGGSLNGNVITGPTTSGVDISGTTGPFRVNGNVSNAATPFVNSGGNTALHLTSNDWTMGSTAHTLTMAGGVVTAVMDWHYVETAGGIASDTLTTINGGYDGAILTLRQATAGHTVLCQDGTGNLRMNGDFALDTQVDAITFRWANDAWIEISRSDNQTIVNTANITANGQAFTPSLKAGTEEFIVASVTGAFAYTVNAPIGATSARFFTVRIRNTAAVAIGPSTWNPIYKMAPWVDPNPGNSRSVTFMFDGTNFVELSRTPADVPN